MHDGLGRSDKGERAPASAPGGAATRIATCAIAVLLSLAGCDQPEWQEFTARYGTYRFPANKVVSTNSSPHRFIRLSPEGEPFELVFDSRIDGSTDRRGQPQIFSLTATPLSGATYTMAREGMVVCRTSLASARCGISVVVNKDRWSVLFPVPLKGQADEFAGRAAAYLTAHTISGEGS